MENLKLLGQNDPVTSYVICFLQDLWTTDLLLSQKKTVIESNHLRHTHQEEADTVLENHTMPPLPLHQMNRLPLTK